MVITDVLEQNANKFSDDISLIERRPDVGIRREITWSDFNKIANKFANALIARGIGYGDKVALLMMNCLEWLPIYFGILKTGALAVPLNFRFTSEEIYKCVCVAEAKVLIYGPEFSESIAKIKKRLTNVKNFIVVDNQQSNNSESFFKMIDECCSDKPEVVLSNNDEAALYFTSGTTGIPKPILLTHANLMAAAVTEKAHHFQTRDDNFLCIPPLYHTGAKMHWFGSLLTGSKAVILRGVKPEWILEAVSEEKATIVWLLVPWAQDILFAIESGRIKLEDYNIEQWRLMHIGAQPVPPSLVKRWKKYFPNQMYDTNYGLSESTGPGCVHLGIENIRKVGAIGRPGYGWQAKIVDQNGKQMPVGKTGELIVKGPGVMKCYYKNAEATKKTIKDGWLYTGDMARQDKEGFIYLVDRKKDVIISGGENIFPVEVEDFLQSNKHVKDVAVIGMPDARLGEVPIAIIELKPDSKVTQYEIEQFCKGLPRYKRPRKIIFDKVPRNPTGKIEKTKLRGKWCTRKLNIV